VSLSNSRIPFTLQQAQGERPICQNENGCFDSVQTVQDLIARTTTRTGLKLLAAILDPPYQTGRKVAQDFKATLSIVFDDVLPQWNYTAVPEVQVI